MIPYIMTKMMAYDRITRNAARFSCNFMLFCIGDGVGVQLLMVIEMSYAIYYESVMF